MKKRLMSLFLFYNNIYNYQERRNNSVLHPLYSYHRFIIMKSKTILTAFILVLSIQLKCQTSYERVPQKKFFNLGLIGIVSTNGENTDITTNNISLSLTFNNSQHIYGFSFAPFNHVNSQMYGLQLGLLNGASETKGMQLGFTNGTEKLQGIQIGYINFINKESGGVQLGVMNSRKSSGLQVGLLNIADNNDYPIGFVNIIKNGSMHAGTTIDDMSFLTAAFRSGGRYLYGLAGIGYSFASSLNQFLAEGGIGVHRPVTSRFRIDTEVSATYISKTYMYMGDPDKAKEKANGYNYKTAFRLSARMMPTYRMGRHIELFGGPSINYLQSQCMENERIFPAHYVWRKFTPTSLKQIHWGWTAGVQYKI